MRKFVLQKETAALLCPLGFLRHPDGCDHDDDQDDQDECDIGDQNYQDIDDARNDADKSSDDYFNIKEVILVLWRRLVAALREVGTVFN